MKHSIFLFFILTVFTAAPFHTNGQGYPDSIPGISLISADHLGNCYVISGSELWKIDPAGRHLNNFSRKDYGTITQIDTRDPLRILIFYKDFGVVRLLDNQLGEQSVLDLRASGITDPGAVVSAIDDGYWIYERISNQLLRYDSRLQQQKMVVDLFQLLGHPLDPKGMQVSGNWLLIYEPKACYLFDRYGTYVKTFPLASSVSLVQLEEESIRIGDSSGMHLLDLKFNRQEDLPLPYPASARQAFYTHQNYWIMMPHTLLRIPVAK